MDPIVDPVHGLPLWTTPNFEDEFYERSKLILRTLNGRNCVNKLYFLSGFWSPHIKRLFQFFLNSIPKERKRSREEVVFLCIFSVSLCCVTTQQLCRRLGQEEIKHADWVSFSGFPFLKSAWKCLFVSKLVEYSFWYGSSTKWQLIFKNMVRQTSDKLCRHTHVTVIMQVILCLICKHASIVCRL